MRRLTAGVITALIVALLTLGYMALIGFESSLLSDRFVLVRREEAASALSTNARSPESLRVAISEESSRKKSDEGSGREDTVTIVTEAHASNASVSVEEIANGGSNATAAEQQLSATPSQEPVHVSAEPAAKDLPQVQELDEILTPEMIQHIESRDNNANNEHNNNREDPLAPVQVHMVWIGDTSKMPSQHTQYRERGYNLTVHSDPEEILDGFHPFVLKAYRLALPSVVGYDFLKFALLYKHGGLSVDADTYPAVDASEVQRQFPRDECELVFGKEASAPHWDKPVFRKSGGPTYGLSRPFQILNWAMAASKPRNKHVKWLLQTAMMHFFGLRDMELSLVQDISGSGLMTDYVALLHEKEGRSYREVYEDHSKFVPVEGLCLTDGYLHGKWIHHLFTNTWRQPGSS